MFADLFKHNVKAVVDAGGEVEIAFLGEKALRSFVSYVPNEWGCTHELEITVTASPKFGSGHTYVQDGVFRIALERKGEELTRKRCAYTECPGVKSEVRLFKMKDVEGFGGFLRFGAAIYNTRH